MERISIYVQRAQSNSLVITCFLVFRPDASTCFVDAMAPPRVCMLPKPSSTGSRHSVKGQCVRVSSVAIVLHVWACASSVSCRPSACQHVRSLEGQPSICTWDSPQNAAGSRALELVHCPVRPLTLLGAAPQPADACTSQHVACAVVPFRERRKELQGERPRRRTSSARVCSTSKL